MASEMSEVVAELQRDEQACYELMLGESHSLSGECSSIINQSHQHRCFIESVSCVDSHTIGALSRVILCN